MLENIYYHSSWNASPPWKYFVKTHYLTRVILKRPPAKDRTVEYGEDDDTDRPEGTTAVWIHNAPLWQLCLVTSDRCREPVAWRVWQVGFETDIDKLLQRETDNEGAQKKKNFKSTEKKIRAVILYSENSK